MVVQGPWGAARTWPHTHTHWRPFYVAATRHPAAWRPFLCPIRTHVATMSPLVLPPAGTLFHTLIIPGAIVRGTVVASATWVASGQHIVVLCTSGDVLIWETVLKSGHQALPAYYWLRINMYSNSTAGRAPGPGSRADLAVSNSGAGGQNLSLTTRAMGGGAGGSGAVADAMRMAMASVDDMSGERFSRGAAER